MSRLIQLIYLMLPVYCANMAPPFVKYWPGWNRPIDARRLGSHKTVVGFISGIIAACAVVYIQSRIQWPGNLVSYNNWLSLGLATGFGAMLGDTAKSFFKRRIGIAPGNAWLPWDQLDFILGGLLALAFWVRLSMLDLLAVLAFSFIADIIVNHLSFYIGIRETRW